MVSFAINHMTAANTSYKQLLAIAQECGCSGVELRNDLATPLFDAASGQQAAMTAESHGLQIYALAEIAAFNRCTANTLRQAKELAARARDCGAHAIVLIPANDGSNPDQAERKIMLTESFSALLPVLEEYDICAFVEPLGFESSTLRYKSEVVERIDAMNLSSRFKLIHDTFHHHLAGEDRCFAAHTGMVHVSGVVDSKLKPAQMHDSHRVLVNAHDQLGNIKQLDTLISDGYRGPVSMEVFAAEVHQSPDLSAQLLSSYQFISSRMAALAA